MRQIKLLLLMLLTGLCAEAQVTGVKTIPGDYADLAAAIADLNTVGVGAGGATINLTVPQTAPAGGYLLGSSVLNASTSAANPLVFNGANNTITSFAGVSTTVDGIFTIAGTDYVTINSLNLAEDVNNLTATTQMEWGYGILKRQNLSPYDGCQNVTINGCTITLNRLNLSSKGVYIANHINTSTTTFSLTLTTDRHSDITVKGCTIQNCFTGISSNGFANAAPYTLFDQNMTFGGPTPADGNTIQNFAGGATTGYGIYAIYANNLVIKNNNVNNIAGGGVAGASTLYGIFVSTCNNSNVAVTKNTVAMTQGPVTSQLMLIGVTIGAHATTASVSNTVNVDSNNVTMTNNGTSAVGYGVYTTGTYKFSTFNANVFNGTCAGTGTQYLLYSANTIAGTGTGNRTIDDNKIMSFTRTAASGGTYGLYTTGGTTTVTAPVSIQRNLVQNINYTNPLNTGLLYSIYDFAGNATLSVKTMASDTVQNIVKGSGTNYNMYTYNYATGSEIKNNVIQNITGTGGTMSGPYIISTTNGTNIYGNIVRNIVNSGTTGTTYGWYQTVGTGVNFYNNLITNLEGGNTTGGAVYGMWIAGTSYNIYNNQVSDIRTPFGNSTSPVYGMYFNSPTTANVYHNTINLNPVSAGLNFGATGLYYTATGTLDLRNNIINVDATAAGTGFVAAVRRASGTAAVVPANLSANTNGNIYFAPNAPNSWLYAEGTVNPLINAYNLTNDANFNTSCGSTYKAFMSPRDAATFSENNLVPDLVPGAFRPNGASYAESGAVAIALPAITTDFNGAPRVAPTDIGASLFAGSAIDAVGPIISYTPITTVGYCNALPTIIATITDAASGVNSAPGTKPRLYYKKTTDNNTYVGNTSADNGWKYVEASNAASPFSFSMDQGLLQAAPLIGESIQYFVVAQDLNLTPNLSVSVANLTSCPPTVNLTAGNFPTLALPAVNQFVLAAPAPPTLAATANPTAACLNGSSVLTVTDTITGPVGLPGPLANYGNAVFTYTSEDELFNVTVNGTPLNNTSNCVTVAPGAGSVAGAYGNYTTGFAPNQTAEFIAGASYTGTLTNGDCGSSGSHYAAIFLDYNRNGLFDLPQERVWGAPNFVPFSNVGVVNAMNFTVPAASTPGQTLMRVIVNESNFATATATSWGETEDYIVTIKGTSGLPNSAYTWTGGTITGNPNTTVTASNITANTIYTVTATDNGGCTATATVQVDLAVPIVATGTTGTTTYCNTVASTNITVTTTGGSTPINTVWTGGPFTNPTVPVVLCAPITGFSGPYAPANWVTTQTNSNGSVNAAGAPGNIILTSSDGFGGGGSPGTTDYSITVGCAGTVTFNWNYTTVDGSNYDYPRYRVNGGAPVIFSSYNTAGGTPQSGTQSIPVAAGDVIGLQAYSTDNLFGACTITISNFSAPGSTTVNAVAGTTANLNPPVGSTTYTVMAVDACGSTSTTTVTINVGPVVVLSSVPASGAICTPGDSVVITATAAGGTFSWLPVTGLSAPASGVTTAIPAATTTYTVTSTANGCLSTATQTVIVADPLVATITQNLPNPLCGVNPTLTVTATGGGAAGPPANGAKYYIRDADPWGSAAFNTGLNAAFGAGNWTALTYAAATPATIFVPSTQFVYLEGSSGTEASQVTYLAANLPLIEAWVNNGGRLLLNRGPNAAPATVNFGFGGVTLNYNSPQGTVNVNPLHPIAAGPFTPAGAGPYTGGSYSHAHITGPGITPIITGGGVNVLAEKQWGNGLVLFGGYTAPSFHSPAPNAQNLFQNWMTYCATAALGVPYTYSWTPGGSTSNQITATTSGTYSVVVNSPVGCPADTASIVVTINPAVTVTTTGTPTSVCPGGAVSLNATGVNATDYTWNPGSLSGAAQTVNPMVSTTYTVTASNASTGCTSVSTVAISTLPSPVFTTTTATPGLLCPNDPTTLTTDANVTIGSPGPGPYTISTIPYAPLTPAGPTTAGPAGDDTYTSGYPIGFTFPFFGVNKTTFGISTNGFISFDPVAGAGCCAGQALPNAAAPNDLIALGWADLNTAGGGTIDYFTLTSPNRLVVRYNGVAQYSVGLPNQINGQIVLYQDGTIDMHITQMSLNNTVTIGVENASGTVGNALPGYSGTAAPVVLTNQSRRFSQFTTTPVTNFLWSDAITGVIATPAAQTTTANPTAAYTYTVTATAGNGCTATSTVAVTMKPFITGTAIATPTAVCIGGSSVLSGNVPPICGGVDNGFAGQYAPVNWTLALINSAGTVNTAGAPANVILSTGSNITGNPGYTTYSKEIPCSGNVTFNWATSTSLNNLPFLGQPQYRINSGAWTNMPGFNTGAATMAQSGTANIVVAVNDTITLATYTLTNDAADAFTLTVSNFSAPAMPINGFVDFWDAPTGGTNLGANPTVTPLTVGTATYYAQFNTSNPMGCTDPVRTPVTINVNGLPAVTATATPAAICLGGSSVLTGGGAGVGANYVWNGPNADPYTVTPATTSTYTVTGTDANGCVNTASATVTVNPLPVITTLTATPDPICPNGSSTLTVAPGLAGGATYCTPTYSTGSGFGDYIASVGGILTNVTGPSASPYYNYFLAPSAAVTAGTSYALNVTVGTYSQNDVAAWIDYDQNGTFDASEKIGETYNIGSGATAVFNFTPPITALNGTTRLRIREADQGGTNLDPCAGYSFGETEDYDVTISGGTVPPPSFASITWSPATFLNVTNTASVTASAVTATTTYTVQGTDANGCSVTSSVTLTMTPAPTGNTFGTPIVIGTLPYSTTGDNLLANCWSNAYTGASNQSSADVFYQFVMPSCNDSVNINTCTGSNYDTWIHLLDNAGTEIASNDDNCGAQSNINFSGLTPGATYYVVVEGFSTASGNYGLSVSTHQSSTLVPAGVTASPNPACENATVTLTGTGAGAGGSYVYAGPATVTGGQFTATLAAAGVYTVTATTAAGCTATATVNVTVNAQPVVTVSSTPSPATVCLGGSVTLTGGGATTYTWSDGSITPADNVAFVPTGTSTFTVTGTDGNGCVATATVPVTVNPLPVVTAAVSATPICLGASTTFTGGGASTYAWTDGVNTPADATPFTPAAAGTSTYTVTGTDGNGCTATSTVALVVNGTGSFNPPVTVSSSCPGALGSSVLVSSTGTVGAVTYSVDPSYPAQPVAGIFNGMLGGASYTVTLSDANGCTASTTLNGPANPTNGELANATLANAASQAGNTCQGQNQADGTSMSYYGATCDDLIVSVSDNAGGNVLGNVNACVTVLPGVQTYNGQPYIRRWYDIVPQNQGPATLTFYFTHEDITGFNANAGSYPQIAGVPPVPSNGNTISFLCSQVPQGFLPGAPGANTTLHNVTATWSAATNRWEAVISVASFSGFYFHTGSLPLPVALTKFDGRKLNSSNLLEWSTASEQNNAHFNLQYSTNGSDFATIAKVDSKAPNGMSSTMINYSFEHLTPALGHNYYRLQQVDLDKQSTLNAKVVDLIWGTNGSTVSIYPNPTQDVLNIDLYTSKVQNTTVKVLDMSGRIVKQIQARSEVGMNKLSISLGEVAGGIYTVQVFENDQLTHVDKVRKADK